MIEKVAEKRLLSDVCVQEVRGRASLLRFDRAEFCVFRGTAVREDEPERGVVCP